MALSGYVDRISAHDVTGWAHDARLPGQSLTLELLRDGAVVAQVRADQYRADLKAVGLGDGRHGFAVAIPPGRRGGALSVRVRGTEFLLTDTTGVQRERWAARLLHAREGDPALPVGFARRQPDAEDVAIAAGMLRHWATWRGRDAESAFIPAGGMWQYVQAQFQQDFVRCLDQDDAAALAGFLVRLPTTPTGEGFMQSAQATQDLLRSGMPGQIAAAVPAFDMLLSIANYLDCIPEENPEQGAWGEALRTPADAVLAAIEARVGHRVAPVPVFDHAFGLLSGDRVMDDRDAQALYAALRVRECGRGGPVLEIGGGIGKLAGQAWMLGLRGLHGGGPPAGVAAAVLRAVAGAGGGERGDPGRQRSGAGSTGEAGAGVGFSDMRVAVGDGDQLRLVSGDG